MVIIGFNKIDSMVHGTTIGIMYGPALQNKDLHSDCAVPSEVEYDISKDISILFVNMTQTSASPSISDTVRSSDVIMGTA